MICDSPFFFYISFNNHLSKLPIHVMFGRLPHIEKDKTGHDDYISCHIFCKLKHK
jgi:hypothetical protein